MDPDDRTSNSLDVTRCAGVFRGFEVARPRSMHDAVGALREPETDPGDPHSRFSGPAFWPARGSKVWALMDMTSGDPNDPIEPLGGGHRQAPAARPGGREGL
jgi:hypothetical protein